MHLFRGLHNIPQDFGGCIATIGNFDGLHLGHQSILSVLSEVSEDEQLPSLVIIFEPQPKEFFAKESAPVRLSNFREKFKNFDRCGVDFLLCLPFNESLRSMTAEAFIQEILVNKLKLKHLLVGDDFRFGCDRKGDYQALSAAGKEFGFGVEDFPSIEVGDERVSSTAVRRELAKGHLLQVTEMLGSPYRMSGRVAYGRQLGRTLDTPTANVMIKRDKLPLSGVFAVNAYHEETQESYIGVANMGVKPTVSEQPEPSLEVHLFGFEGDLYHQHLTVSLLHKIRDEQKFDGIQALQETIEKDKRAAKQYFALRADAFRF